VSDTVRAHAWKAQHRLYRRYVALAGRKKPMQKIVGALGRELLGFVWAVAIQIERELQHAASTPHPQQLAA
jgi:transposase